MGTASTTKYIVQSSGYLKQQAALTTSAGAGDAQAIPALNSSGQLDITMMPTGVGADIVSVTASEALSAGAFVNLWNNSGTTNARNADGSTTGKFAQGFVLAAVSSSGTASVYLTGLNTAVTGATPGPVFLSDSAVGSFTATAPTTSGHTSQYLGIAITATSIQFDPGPVIQL
jgi:hypothetical protein